MSQRVHERLFELGLLPFLIKEQKEEIDKEIELETGKYCDDGIEDMTNEDLIRIVKKVVTNSVKIAKIKEKTGKKVLIKMRRKKCLKKNQ